MGSRSRHARPDARRGLLARSPRPPFLRDRHVIVSHPAAILFYIGRADRLAPTDEDGVLWTRRIQLTIADIVKEISNSHHPIDEDKSFHETDKAIARAASFAGTGCRSIFRAGRADPRAKIQRVQIASLAASSLYADLSLFQLVEGLRFAFPSCPREYDEAATLNSTPPDGRAGTARLKAYLAQ